MVVPLSGCYFDCVKDARVLCRVYEHGHWDEQQQQHYDKMIGVETVIVSKSFTCPGLGSTICVKRRPDDRSYPLCRDQDGAFCITI